MTTRIVTLTIDNSNAKLLVAQGNEVKKWAGLALEPGLVKDGVITDPERLAQELRELLHSQGVNERTVIAGLSGLHCMYRILTLPDLPKSVFAEAVEHEAERQLPVSLDELYLSWQVIHRTKDDIRVFLAACPRNASNALMETLKKAGVQPLLLDLTPLALARVADKATAIIADTRSSEADIVIMVQGVPELIRGLSLPTEAVTTKEKLSIVKEELERTIKFYNANNPDKALSAETPIYISGELGEEFNPSVLEGLGYPVRLLHSPMKCSGGFTDTQYMVNIGLALRKMSVKGKAGFSVVNVNFIPKMYQPKPMSLSKILVAPCLVAAICVVAPLVTQVRGAAADTGSIQLKLDSVNQLVAQRQKKQQDEKKEITALQDAIKKLKDKGDGLNLALASFDRQRNIVKGNLEIVTRSLNDKVTLVTINRASDVLTVNGSAPAQVDILAYVKSLEDSGQFGEVIITDIKQTEQGYMDFTLTMKKELK